MCIFDFQSLNQINTSQELKRDKEEFISKNLYTQE